jgi:hypothetical protein
MEMDPKEQTGLLLRKLTEVEECAHQALSVASSAQMKIDGLTAAIERLTQRIDGLRVEIKAIAEITG